MRKKQNNKIQLNVIYFIILKYCNQKCKGENMFV